MNDLLFYLFGFVFLFLFGFLVSKFNNKYSNNLSSELDPTLIKILGKKCSVKKINSSDIVDKRFTFDNCNLFVSDKFIAFQGIQNITFKQILVNIIFCENQSEIKLLKWDVVKPISVELSKNENEIKVVFKPTKSISSSDYSLIIKDLSVLEFKNLSKIVTYSIV
ncbi:hypothetical protein BC748_0980 [Flavobacterium dankookense]|uniref:Uncharacterized protein n=1 Tax=Flavobacterium dankookense TaxID=706186 RepID=A0A4R6QEV3_9FLAO|nr:hypothetical protein BC748_0980 [Flavobacterium dankookense]